MSVSASNRRWIEAVRVVLGHQTLKMADHYAKRDHGLARRVAMEVG